jgi:uncharacterized alpha-E superfamily protein
VLSRIAQSLFWIGRYLERAEDTSRILDVQLNLLVEDPAVDEESASRSLLAVMGAEPPAHPDRGVVMRDLGYDRSSSNSIASAIESARESARRARETVSSDMWSAINTTWNGVAAGRLQHGRPGSSLAWSRERVALINGIAESTMSRDEGWHFLLLGRSIERADMVARLVAATSMSAGPTTAWNTTLRACGAHEAFLRTYRGLETEREAAEFLLLDRLFPRSIVHALSLAEECLHNLDATGSRSGFDGEASRLLGRARAELEYRPLMDILADLPEEMERVQLTCSQASDAISETYFAGAVATAWLGGGATA